MSVAAAKVADVIVVVLQSPSDNVFDTARTDIYPFIHPSDKGNHTFIASSCTLH
eukprot:m.216803 g.216803  ORF g.216803 m.216803 type:complete len:54 (+) comp16984_c1_seq45:2814-2975(+)